MKNKIFVFLLILLVIFPLSALAAANSITRQYNFTASLDPRDSETYPQEILENLSIDGASYVISGVVYDNITWVKNELATSQTNISREVIYSKCTAQPEIPPTIEYGEHGSIELNDIISNAPYWINIQLTGEIQVVGEKHVAPTAVPEIDESELLAMIGKSSADYQIEAAVWSGDEREVNGQYWRDVSVSGKELVRDYTAIYRGTVSAAADTSEHYEITATATYIPIASTEISEPTTLTLTAEERQELSTAEKVMIAAGALVIAIGVVLLLLYISKKRKLKNKENHICKV